MTPTPPLPAEDADVEAVREEALTWLRGQRSDAGKTEDIINGLLAALQEAERERDELRGDMAMTWEQTWQRLCAAEAREAAAQAWYQDHRTTEGIYDEAMWGDPFAISPQLRAALADPGTYTE